MTSDATDPSAHPLRRWGLLLVGSSVFALIGLLLLLHAYGLITLGLLADPEGGRLERDPLVVARERACGDLDAALERGDYAEAERAVEGLGATATELLAQLPGRVLQRDVDAIHSLLPALHAEVHARRALALKAWRLAYETLWPHARPGSDGGGHAGAVRARVAALLARAQREVERTEPIVPGLVFVRIPPGAYSIGTPADEPRRRERAEFGNLPDLPVRRVQVPRAYWICTTEMPRSVYARVHLPKAEWSGELAAGTADLPASHVRWEDARLVCAALNRTSSVYEFDLPTEAEWEIACRAMQAPSVGPFVVEEARQSTLDAARSSEDFESKTFQLNTALQRYAVFAENIKGLLQQYQRQDPPVPMRLKRPNRLGLLDVHGGLAEWCHPEEGAAEAPVLRGGHCQSDYADLRAGARKQADPTRPTLYGIRLVARERLGGP